jgi:TfoX/Sxy family transcriptional regulator of competence genes
MPMTKSIKRGARGKTASPSRSRTKAEATPKVAWRKAPPDLIERFEAALPEQPGVERRTMFGYPCAFVGGQMFAGLFAESVIVRLSEDERQTALASQGATVFEPMRGRVMREYVVVPDSVAQDGRALRAWLRRALDCATRLPPKAMKKR